MLLTVCNGLHEGWTIRLVKESYSLGRNRDNDLIMVDRWISRRHCLFSQSNGRWQVIDLGSTHGVRVNGTQIRDQHLLRDGDSIELGEVRLQVNDSPDAAPLSGLEMPSVQEHPAVLRIESGPQAGLEVRLENQTYTVGRVAKNDITLSDPTISRRHCLIGLSKSDWYILDLNSRHGVLVNGELIEERQVLHGDEAVQVGDIQMALRFVFDPLAGEGQRSRSIPRPLVLSVRDGLHEEWEIPLIHPSYTLGRSRCNDIILADPSISRIHCLFVYHRGNWTVEDLGSSLGVLVNGKAIDTKQLLRGCEQLRIGDVNILVRDSFTPAAGQTDSVGDRSSQKRARRKLRIIQTLPVDMDSTFVFDRDPDESPLAGLETTRHDAPIDQDSAMDQTISIDGPGRRLRDEHEMNDTVNFGRTPLIDPNQAMPLDNEEYIKTYSMQMPDEFRQLRDRYRHDFGQKDRDDD